MSQHAIVIAGEFKQPTNHPATAGWWGASQQNFEVHIPYKVALGTHGPTILLVQGCAWEHRRVSLRWAEFDTQVEIPLGAIQPSDGDLYTGRWEPEPALTATLSPDNPAAQQRTGDYTLLEKTIVEILAAVDILEMHDALRANGANIQRTDCTLDNITPLTKIVKRDKTTGTVP
jgi:hypothetical protein